MILDEGSAEHHVPSSNPPSETEVARASHGLKLEGVGQGRGGWTRRRRGEGEGGRRRVREGGKEQRKKEGRPGREGGRETKERKWGRTNTRGLNGEDEEVQGHREENRDWGGGEWSLVARKKVCGWDAQRGKEKRIKDEKALSPFCGYVAV